MGESIKPIETQYSHNPNTREYTLFPEEYFSGSQVSIFFNHKHLVDCSGFSFALQEQHKPIYSYASRTFDEMSIGNRLVTGSFRVAFKDAAKLNAILNDIENYKVDTTGAASLFLEGEDVPPWISAQGLTPELLLGMGIEHDPNIIKTDVTKVKIYYNGDLLDMPNDNPAMLVNGWGKYSFDKTGVRYTFVPIRWQLAHMGYERGIKTGDNEYTFTHKDGTSVFTVNYSTHIIKYNGVEIKDKYGDPLMAFEWNDREYVHIRVLYEAKNYKIDWNEKLLTVNITSN